METHGLLPAERKALRSGCHGCTDALLLYQVMRNVICQNRNNAAMPLWVSEIKVGFGKDAVLVPIKLRRGLFQGDSLSPLLLFCLTIAPLSSALNEEPGTKPQTRLPSR